MSIYPLHPRLLCAKFGWNWSSGSGEEDENVKNLQTDRQTDRQTTDDRWSEKLIWAFSSGELKISRHFESTFKYKYLRSKSSNSMCSKFSAHAVDERKKVSTRKYFEKLINCAYFMIRKKWNLSINFEELIRFLGNLEV